MVELIEYMRGKGGVWFATTDEISKHVRKSIAEGIWKPRVDKLPFYDSPIQAVHRLRGVAAE
jgi:hypothetical protein